MPPPIVLSKLKLLSFLRCPRKVWLEQYSPELEDEDAIERDALVAERIRARIEDMHGQMGGRRITGERGLRAAVSETAELVAAGTDEPVFDAAVDHHGLTVLIDRLELTPQGARLLTVVPAASVEDRHLDECAIQAWTLAGAGVETGAISIGLLDAAQETEKGSDAGRSGLTEVDVTEAALARLPGIEDVVARARATLAELDEPAHPTGAHCRVPATCPFLDYCASAT